MNDENCTCEPWNYGEGSDCPMHDDPKIMPSLSAVEIKEWTASDAQNALMMVDKNGRQFQVNAIGWDGTVHVVASDTIKPEERDGWRLFSIQQNA